MKKWLGLLLVVVALLCLVNTTLAMQNEPVGGKKTKGATAAKNELYAAIVVDNQIQTAPKSKIEKLKKDAEAKYNKARKDYDAAKKEATKNKEAFDQPRPTKAVIKVVRSSFKSQEEAKEFCEQYVEDHPEVSLLQPQKVAARGGR